MAAKLSRISICFRSCCYFRI